MSDTFLCPRCRTSDRLVHFPSEPARKEIGPLAEWFCDRCSSYLSHMPERLAPEKPPEAPAREAVATIGERAFAPVEPGETPVESLGLAAWLQGALIRCGLLTPNDIKERAKETGQTVQGLLTNLEEIGPYGAELTALAMGEDVVKPKQRRKKKTE